MHVLIVEDDTLLAMNLQVLIEDLGALSTIIAPSATAAVEHARRYRPNFIVADLHLVDGSGVAAVREIQESYGPVPVVYVTGSPEEARRLDPTALILSKPLKDLELVAAIERLRPLMTELS